MNKENPNSPAAKHANPHDEHQEGRNDQPVPGKEVDEFFQRLPGSFHWPKPNAEAVAAAMEAIQRISGGSMPGTPSASAGAEPLSVDAPGKACSACGGVLPAGARFCVWCGISNEPITTNAAAPSSPAGGQHHFHHHYHHIVPSPAGSGRAPAASVPTAEPESSAAFVPQGRAPGAPGSTGGRAEAGARQMVQDWAQACNTRHIDDLLELYAADATIIRSSVPPVRSLAAIREFLVSLLDAGLGDVEMESLRLEVMGDIALDLGRCKMLVPVAMGKRREERGKYLVVLVKQPTGIWKIIADCWSSDLPVGAPPPPPEPAARKSNEPPVHPARKFR
ncbi:MAG: nuclear transport factor 2 family protein [Terriglobales bacterium]